MRITATYFAIAIAAVLGTFTLTPMSAALAQDMSASMMGGTFASVKTEITDTQIIITIDKNPNAPPVPDGPIIVIPPNETSGPDNGTVILPVEPEAPNNNATVISPEGNVTQIPDGNVTVVDNSTVIVDSGNSTITPIPDDIVVVSPPPGNATNATEPCGCPPVEEGVQGGAPDIQFPNATSPIVGGNVTLENETTIIRPDTEPGEESGGNGQDGSDGSNGDSSNGE